MSSLTHNEAEKLTYILLHKSQQVLSLMHKVENHCGLHSVNFLIYHIGMEVGIEGSLVICCAKSLCTAGSVAWKLVIALPSRS
jgi:hypothetical protein